MRIQTLRDEHGMALLVAVVLLLMVSAIGLAALQSAQDEASGSGRARRKTMTLYAADSALTMVEDRLNVAKSQYPDTGVINNTTFMQDQWGGATAVRTGNSENPLAQPIVRVGASSQAAAGYQLNVNASGTFSYGIYRTGVVATDQTGGAVELQAQYSVNEGASSYK